MTPLEMAKKAQFHLVEAEQWKEADNYDDYLMHAQTHALISIGYATTLQALLTQGPWPGEGPDE
jgi:predicted cobalt transporter CbtA